MFWEQEGEWETVLPLLPVMTVEGRLVWLRRCQRRTLRMRYGAKADILGPTCTQYRVLPVSEIWRTA